ncbi:MULTISPECIES: SDR family NAD(P)-dependent oxidoreductase [Mesonia]|uniref:2,5-dichloro-2,5-cyclohexadiene-1,4-diol dehydrogenase n=1 Tax=Mesonia oceanica TaxID=2687242 RepID=A0AC61Y840_9FLAO|nr:MULTISPECIES: glucose 1-dehydrogenase [Mesonia]MAN27605.1 short-chain dehydrogenase [Mesonia sp.]MAQ40210.1 short-chain dehydrogenase [Mesonia sp.]MBJ97121.1 short-chain dehydrogenase [Flavobacteriaceae bacterium]VVV00637.1 2,5-dichloro-2,5-cyclohexadiene-1,4-diol dehydrogenase [Mesonia oceanica]|tara:strand:- start:19555 stop:20307 length:753 start_codon:yes stop_codon:yes gene_type:complete
MKTLEDKVALITGAGSGIGKSTALLFAEHGAKIIVTDINEEHGTSVVKEIESNGGEAIFIKADTSKPKDSEMTVQKSIEKFGKLDIAVNNAGIGGPAEPIGNYPIDDWDKVISINLSGVFYGMRYQLPEMEKAGKGSIINVASILGQVGFANSCAYVAAKHGVVGLTKNAGIEYGKTGVRVNAVGPAFIETPLVKDSLSEEAYNSLAEMHPMGRLGRPHEVAELFLWLASDKASFATGAYYPLDGGYLAK